MENIDFENLIRVLTNLRNRIEREAHQIYKDYSKSDEWAALIAERDALTILLAKIELMLPI